MDWKSLKHSRHNPEEFKRFSQNYVRPLAMEHDTSERISRPLISQLADQGYLGAAVSKEFNGLGLDYLTFGWLNFELGKCCTAVRSLVTVQSMVAQVLEKWGTPEQKKQWLEQLATGKKLAGFALTEPDRGSDASGIQTQITECNDSYIINGTKKWISFGQIADLFLVFGQHEGQLCCLLLSADTKGLTVKPIVNILGARGSMLASLEFDGCKVTKESLVGSVGFGLLPVGFTALDVGRYSIAWGCVGMAQACLEESVAYVKSREQFGSQLSEYQLIQALISDMIVDIKAAQLLCEKAGCLKQENHKTAMREMLAAKYFAANMAVRVTGKAVQIHGANGYQNGMIVERFFRDAKIMETIEGSNQMMQIMIAKYSFQDY